MKIIRNIIMSGFLMSSLLAGVQAGAEQATKGPSLEAPKGLRVKSHAREAVLLWQPVQDSLGYRIYWEKDADGDVSQASPWLADTDSKAHQYTAADLTPGVSYTFRVSALYASGEGPLSNQARIVLKKEALEVPSDSAP